MEAEHAISNCEKLCFSSTGAHGAIVLAGRCYELFGQYLLGYIINVTF